MPTYVYETIPSRPGEVSRRFEVKQSMKDEPLHRDPESGLPVRRVISGGFAPMTSSADASPGCDSGACAMPQPPRHSCGAMCGCAAN
jgi:hypothetical protein